MLLWACVLWALASAGVAMLPMRYQYVPGVLLLIAAPALILWIGVAQSWWAAALAVFAFVSMYRNPLAYVWARMRGKPAEVPK